MTIRTNERWIAKLLALLTTAGMACAQEWQDAGAIDVVSDTMTVDRALLDLENGILVCGRTGQQGGDVHMFGKDIGGADQWEQFGSLVSTEAGFANDIALHHALLAIGSSGDPNSGIDPGSVSILVLDPDGIQPVVEQGVLVAANGIGGDRFGHAVHWYGDSLLVGAPGRNHPDGTGAVYAFKNAGQTWNELGVIQPDPDLFPLPALYGFGHDIASSGDRMVVASPGSGYAQGVGSGALHVYQRTSEQVTGWTPTAVLYDLSSVEVTVEGSTYSAFATGQLGYRGLFLSDSLLLADAIGPDSTVVQGSCTGCPLRAFRHSVDGTWTPTPENAPQVAFPRSQYGTWAGDTEALINGLDTLTGLWFTTWWRYMDDGTWSVQDTLWADDTCTVLNGPVMMDGDRFARMASREGVSCGAPPGERAWTIELFERPSTVGITSTNPRPFSITWSGDRSFLTTDLVGTLHISILTMGGACVAQVSAIGPGTVSLALGPASPGIYMVRVIPISSGTPVAARFFKR